MQPKLITVFLPSGLPQHHKQHLSTHGESMVFLCLL
jgi:hypothetical protein